MSQTAKVLIFFLSYSFFFFFFFFFLFPLILQSSSQQILIGFVDYLEINEPEEPRDKDEELGKGKQECTCHGYCPFDS